MPGAAEFEEDLSGCPLFAGTFDVQELRRIFDNLSSNVHKYADPGQPVYLDIRVEVGLRIRPIARNYGGSVDLRQDGSSFSIAVTLTEYL